MRSIESISVELELAQTKRKRINCFALKQTSTTKGKSMFQTLKKTFSKDAVLKDAARLQEEEDAKFMGEVAENPVSPQLLH